MGPAFFPPDVPDEWKLIYNAAADDLRQTVDQHRRLALLAGLDEKSAPRQLLFALWEVLYRRPSRWRARVMDAAAETYASGRTGQPMPEHVARFVEPSVELAEVMQRIWVQGSQESGRSTVGFGRFWKRRRPLPEEPVTDQRGAPIEVGDRLRDLAAEEWLDVVAIEMRDQWDYPVVVVQEFGGSRRDLYTLPRGSRFELMDDLVVRGARSATEMRRLPVASGRRRRLPGR